MDYIEKQFPQLKEHVSHNLSPGGHHRQVHQGDHSRRQGGLYRALHRKKMEVQKERVKPYIDSCITFEELQALFDSRDIDLKSLPEGVLGQRPLLRAASSPAAAA